MKRWAQAMPIIQILILLGTNTACRKGEYADGAKPSPLHILSLNVLDYDAEQVQLHMRGLVQAENSVSLDQLEFYHNPACQGSPAGKVLIENFAEQGVLVTIPRTQERNVYVTTSNSRSCLLALNYNDVALRPGIPSFQRTSPQSPTRETTRPGIYGLAFPRSGQIEFFEDEQCQKSVGSGSGTDYQSNGVRLNLVAGKASRIHARIRDALGQTSPCTFLAEYSHRNSIIPSPVFLGSTPWSPSNSSTEPIIKGSTVPEVKSITLYSDADCSLELATGSTDDFAAAGIKITVSPNSSTHVYGKVVDDLGNPSSCTLLTTYIHDSLPPEPPQYLYINPTSPNNSVTMPRVSGLATDDTLSVKFYDSALCLKQIGSDIKSTFEGSGVPASVGSNAVTTIYATSVDAAGNASECTYLTFYKHNTIPPQGPVFLGSEPMAPTNATTSPYVFGTPAVFTHHMKFYDDEACTHPVGEGSPEEFAGDGIQVHLRENVNNQIYVKVSDLEGNISSCIFLANYDHSNLPAENVNFMYSFPASPSKLSTTPNIIGTANLNIREVTFYDDSSCTQSLGSGTRGQFTSSGIAVSLPANSTTQIHAVARNMYGNYSTCGHLLTYIHNTVPPNIPLLSELTPASPNAISTTPTLTGTATTPAHSQLPAFTVAFYDSLDCTNKIGEGTPAAFAGTGITVNVPENGTTSIHGKVFDEATNESPCTFLQDYTHDNLIPGKPMLTSTTPTTPSYSEHIRLKGIFAASQDFLSRVAVHIYTDAKCTQEIATGLPAEYTGAGIPVSVPKNVMTPLYAASLNEVGTFSGCQFQVNFTHHDLPPKSLSATVDYNGGIYLTWLPDMFPKPAPTYTLERSLSPAGPFSIIATGIMGNTFNDQKVNNGKTYYYRVYGSNLTGRSQNSAVATTTTTVDDPIVTTTLQAEPGANEVFLTWSAHIYNMVYRIHRATQPSGPFTTLPVESSATTYIDKTVANNTTYYYVVTGTNPSGETVQSNVASAYTRPKPLAPTGLTLRPVRYHPACGGVGIELTWVPSSYHEGFAVKRGGSAIGITQVNQYTDCSLGGSAGYNHQYQVAALWGSAQSANSIGAYYRDVAAPDLYLQPGVSSIGLSWTWVDSGANESKYNIYRATSAAGPFTQVVAGTTATNYTDSDVTPGVSYYYYVQTYMINSADNFYWVGPDSATKSASLAPMPEAPSQLLVSENSSTGVKTLAWSAPSHYNQFHIYQATNPGGPFKLLNSTTSAIYSPLPTDPGVFYYYVTAEWGGVQTAASNTVATRNALVSGLNATAASTNITIKWNPVTDAQDYLIWRANAKDGPYMLLPELLTTTYVDTDVVADTGYYYKVQARFADFSTTRLTNPVSAALSGAQRPTGVSLTTLGGTSLKVNWVGVSGATSYKVYLASSAGGPFALKATASASLRDYTLPGLTTNKQYFVYIAAIVGGLAKDSDVVSGYTYEKPIVPMALAGMGQVNLSWVALNEVVSYDVLRSTDAVNFTSLAAGLAGTSYQDTSVSNGTQYFYKIIAHYSFASAESDMSMGVTPGVVPLAPSGLTVANDGSGTGLILKWDQVRGVGKYNIYVSTSPGAHTTPYSNSNTNESVSITGLELGRTYYIAVKSVIGSVESATFSPEQAIVTALDTAAPAVAYAGPTTVRVSWSAVPNASSYTVFRSENGIEFFAIATGVPSANFLDTTADPDTPYFYRYESYNAQNVPMAFSQISTAIILNAAPKTPTGVYAFATNTSSVQVNWIQVPNAATYEVARSTTSGGPYSIIGTVPVPTGEYTDSSTSVGNTYYYVVRAVNSESVASAYSAEVGVRLVNAPANLTAVNVTQGVQLNWTAVAGASDYVVYRSDVAGGPHGQVGTSSTPGYLDTTTLPERTYYYVVAARFADGSVSPRSSEVNIMRSGSLKLEVAIELTDTRLTSSTTGPIAFARTQTRLNTDDYDGVTAYEFEIVASNEDGSQRLVALLDETDTMVTSLAVPPSATPTRVRGTFTPTAGTHTYRLQLEATPQAADLKVEAARLLIQQTNATRTRLYFPLLSLAPGVSNEDLAFPAHQTQGTSYEVLPMTLPYLRETAALATLPLFNAWEIEALLATSGSAEGALAFVNKNNNQIVPSSETRFASTDLTMATIPIDEGVTYFDSLSEGHQYELRLKCEYFCTTGGVALYKAGLWVKLENLTKAVTLYRNASYTAELGAEQTLLTDSRIVDLTRFSNPLTYFQVDLSDDTTSSAEISLYEHDEAQGPAALTLVANSTININNDGRKMSRSVTNLSAAIGGGKPLVSKILPSGGSVTLHSTAITVKSSKP